MKAASILGKYLFCCVRIMAGIDFNILKSLYRSYVDVVIKLRNVKLRFYFFRNKVFFALTGVYRNAVKLFGYSEYTGVCNM